MNSEQQKVFLQKLIDKGKALKQVDLADTDFFKIMNSDNPELFMSLPPGIKSTDLKWIEFLHEKDSYFKNYTDDATNKYKTRITEFCKPVMSEYGFLISDKNIEQINSLLKLMMTDLEYTVEAEKAVAIISENQVAKNNVIAEELLLDYVYKALVNIQRTKGNNEKTENELNDQVRNLMNMVPALINYDQTRHGASTTGVDAGNVDILICDKGGVEKAIYEGLILNSVDTTSIKKHINRTIDNYNPVGCPNIIISVYYIGKKFDDFWTKYLCYIKEHPYAFKVIECAEEITVPNDGLRRAKAVLIKNGKKVNIHYICTFLSC